MRLLSLIMIFAVSTMCVPSDWSSAQESKQKCSECKECPADNCKECPAAKCQECPAATCKESQDCPAAKTVSARTFELPGVDFPNGVRVVVTHDGDREYQRLSDGCIEIDSEYLKNSDVPFLNYLAHTGKGKLWTHHGIQHESSCKSCEQTSSCDDRDKCEGRDRPCAKECPECPVGQTAGHQSVEWNFPGKDFPFGIHVAVTHEENRDDPNSPEGCIEIECEFDASTGIPFLSCLPRLGKLFANVQHPEHPPCAVVNSEPCQGPCSSRTGDDCPHAGKSCQQESGCDNCQGCTIANQDVPFKGPNHDRLFTNIGHVFSNTSKPCGQASGCNDCQKCDCCPSNQTVNAAPTTGPQVTRQHPHGVQLVGFIETGSSETGTSKSADPYRNEMREEMFEIRLENERLKMTVEFAEQQLQMMESMMELKIEAAGQQLEMMEAVMEVREENAVLRTRVEISEAHHGHAAPRSTSPHHPK